MSTGNDIIRFVTNPSKIDIEKAKEEFFIYILWYKDYDKLMKDYEKYKWNSSQVSIWHTGHKNITEFKKWFNHRYVMPLDEFCKKLTFK